ncbi:MAG: exodeoxyribonuclease VII small subunit [Eubacterium sp.]|nr:exodeoxyribonuclease VII small subunit [Eubacterium sp.]
MARKTFEDNLLRLEEIAELMEQEDTTLDKSLKLYKEGTELAAVLGESLKKTRQQVMILKKNAEGAFVKEPFDEGES